MTGNEAAWEEIAVRVSILMPEVVKNFELNMLRTVEGTLDLTGGVYPAHGINIGGATRNDEYLIVVPARSGALI